MITLIRDLGAGYLAGKAMFRNAERNAQAKRDFVTTFTDAFATGAMVLGTLIVPNVSGPIGIAVAGHDVYRNRDAIKAGALVAYTKSVLAVRNAQHWLLNRKPRSAISNVTPITRKPRAKRVKGAQPC